MSIQYESLKQTAKRIAETSAAYNARNLYLYRKRRNALTAARHRWLHDWIPATRPKPERTDWSAVACYVGGWLAITYAALHLAAWAMRGMG